MALIMFRYLSNLSTAMKVLWSYLIWYLYFVYKYFDPDVELWVRSLGIALLVGFALNLNAFCSIKAIVKTPNKCQPLRFFIIPFCVSSFPVLVNDKGFFLFLSPIVKENMIALSFCLAFLSLARVSHFVVYRKQSGGNVLS